MTGLRAIAALMVLLLHLDQTFGSPLIFRLSAVDSGFLGVDVFFVLSGFILAHVYGVPLARPRAVAVAHFLWLRFARLYPIHLLALAVLVAMVGARGLLDTNFWRLADIPAHLLMVHAWIAGPSWNVPAWSVSAEWLAYCLFPAIWVGVGRVGGRVVPVVAILALLAALVLGLRLGDVELSKTITGWPVALRVLCEFTIGCLLFRLAGQVAPSRWFDGLFAVGLAGMLWAPCTTVALVGVVLTVAAAARATGPVHRLLTSHAMLHGGLISYSVYMLHFPVIRVIFNVNGVLAMDSRPLAVKLAAELAWIVVILALAAASHRWVEQPARRWLRRLPERLGRRQR